MCNDDKHKKWLGFSEHTPPSDVPMLSYDNPEANGDFGNLPFDVTLLDDEDLLKMTEMLSAEIERRAGFANKEGSGMSNVEDLNS